MAIPLTCIFCGSDAVGVRMDAGADSYYVVCYGCNAQGPLKEMALAAILAWNTSRPRHSAAGG